MKSFSVLLISLCLFVPIYECAVGFIHGATHPDYPGKCYLEIENHPPLIIAPGNAKKHPAQCLRYVCSPYFSLEIASCGVPRPEPQCWIIDGDPSNPYPGCCNEVIC